MSNTLFNALALLIVGGYASLALYFKLRRVHVTRKHVTRQAEGTISQR
jgi:hypothetical protein